eukprot:6375160-Alexandrium_andersonii.AAC.1
MLTSAVTSTTSGRWTGCGAGGSPAAGRAPSWSAWGCTVPCGAGCGWPAGGGLGCACAGCGRPA